MTKGIYQLHLPNCQKVYIGRSKNIEKRYEQHFRLLIKGKHHNPSLQKLFKGELILSVLLEGNCSPVAEQRYQDAVPRKLQHNYFKGVDDGAKKKGNRRL